MDDLLSLPESTLRRFWAKVRKLEGCWEWTAATAQGYGRFYLRKEGARIICDYTHRLSYLLHKGPIPEGMHVCHSCDNRLCINPDHLWLGTLQDNLHDAVVKRQTGHAVNRRGYGENHYKSYFTAEQASYIKHSPKHYKELGAEFGVDPRICWAIKNGGSWKHLP